jgi:integrase
VARIKAEKRVLSYHEQGRCWRKFFRGKMHYLDPRGVAKSDDASYRKAVANWRTKRAEIELQIASQEFDEKPSMVSILKCLDASQRVDGVKNNNGQTSRVLARIASSESPVACLNVSAVLGKMPAAASEAGTKQTTIAGLIKAYLATKKSSVDAREISRQMYLEYEHNAEVFGDWASQSGLTSTDQIDSFCLSSYRSFILALRDPANAAAGETHVLGSVTVRKRLARLKNLIEWAYETGHLAALPRNLKGFAKMRNTAGELDAEKTDAELFWTVDECRQLFRAATTRTRLYVLLALNCGYTQTDIATLRHAHLDLDAGTITRPRHKTKGKQVHKLWPITIEYLLLEYSSSRRSEPGKGLVLLGKNGLPLIHESKETTTRQDTIRLAFAMVQKTLIKKRLRETRPELFKLAKRKSEEMSAEQLAEISQSQKTRAAQIDKAIRAELKAEPRSFKSFRKTSANIIEREYGDGSKLADQFLGHTQKATKRFYVDTHYEKLFAAIDFLDATYRLGECV